MGFPTFWLLLSTDKCRGDPGLSFTLLLLFDSLQLRLSTHFHFLGVRAQLGFIGLGLGRLGFGIRLRVL